MMARMIFFDLCSTSNCTLHQHSNCRICDDQIAVYCNSSIQFGISLEHCFSQRKGRRRNKKLPSLFKVRRVEGVQAHISRTICTCRLYVLLVGFRHHNQPNQNQLNSRDEFNMILFVSSIFVLTFLQFFCFTHGYMINKSFLHVKVVNAVSFASLNWGYLLYIQRWRRHHLRSRHPASS